MKSLRFLVLIGVVMSALAMAAPKPAASNGEWQTGRIVEVTKDVNTKTLYWVVNTPVTQDETTYTVAIHLKDKILTGTYELGRLQGAPPDSWVKDRAVQVQLDGGTMYLRTPGGSDLKLKITKRKAAAIMRPVTARELADLDAAPAAASDEPMTGFIPPAKESAPSNPPPAPGTAATGVGSPTGVVNVRSTPYLADVYVDGQDMGYTPAKLNLPPGKHTVRFEKAGYKTWSKEITLTSGSELLLDAALERK